MAHSPEELTNLSDKELKALWMKRRVIKKRGQSPVAVIEQIAATKEKVQQIWSDQEIWSKIMDTDAQKDFDLIYLKGTRFRQEDMNLIYQDYLENFFPFLCDKSKLIGLSFAEWENISRMHDRQGFYPAVDRYIRGIIFGPTDHPLYLELHGLANHCYRDDISKMFSEKLSCLFLGIDKYLSEKNKDTAINLV